MNFKKILSLLLLLAMIFTMLVPLVACNQPENPENPENPNDPSNPSEPQKPNPDQNGNATYTIEVKTVGGMKLEGVMCYVHKGDDYQIVGRPKETDSNGIAQFELPVADDYSVELIGVPEGYNVKEGDTKADRYPFTNMGVSITLASSPIKDGSLSSDYKVGDVMHDFTLTDINGNEYNLSDVLESKKLVVLNFWYVGCDYCYKEFPYLNAAYSEYKDDVLVLGINDYANNTLADVEAFEVYDRKDQKIDMQIPFVRVEPETNGVMRKRFEPNDGTLGYPFSVYIDRYGVICLIENGYSPSMSTKLFTNAFDHFTAKTYEQKFIESLDTLVVPELPSGVEQPSSEAIKDALVADENEMDVVFSGPGGKDEEYNWPFVIDTYKGETVLHPSNKDKDNSYSILKAKIQLKADQGIVFDYFSSTDRGYDIMYIIVDGKDTYSISGVEENGWQVCCPYVAPFDGEYEIAFAYQKDGADFDGDDTVYIKNLRIVEKEDVPVDSLIFRFAATKPTANGAGYENYITAVYNEEDGYYHVGSKNGPLLLANMLTFTQFDDDKSLSERIAEAGEFVVDGVDLYDIYLEYGNYCSNSAMYGYTSITQELQEFLVKYVNAYRQAAGKAASDNLWLQLCCYYDAYGPTAKQLEDPIKGLAGFNAFDTVLDDPDTDEIEYNEVTYTRMIVPRGLVYKFVPTKSGVYRVTSHSVILNADGTESEIKKPGEEVNGWIFTGENGEILCDAEGIRVVYTEGGMGERFCPNLIYTDAKGNSVVDHKNISMVAYMEAGKEYYIDIAYYDVYATGSFKFYVEYEGESFDYFVHCSPGPFTFEEENGAFGSTITGGISAAIGEDGYYHHLREDGSLGSIIYADFFYPTNIFPTQSIQQLIEANAFNYNITDTDREALVLLENAQIEAIKTIKNAWGVANFGDEWATYEMPSIINGAAFSDDDEIKAKQEELLAGIEGMWKTLKLDDALDGNFDDAIKAQQEAVLATIEEEQTKVLKKLWGASFEDEWAYYQIDDIKAGIYHATEKDKMTERDEKAKYYLDYLEANGKDALFALWAADEVYGSADFSDEDYDYLYFEYFEMDDVAAGIYHGDIKDYTDIVRSYVDKMLNEDGYPERQGCVAVTEELAKILQLAVDKFIFENVEFGWTKFCFYYEQLGE